VRLGGRCCPLGSLPRHTSLQKGLSSPKLRTLQIVRCHRLNTQCDGTRLCHLGQGPPSHFPSLGSSLGLKRRLTLALGCLHCIKELATQ
jgi:hypothetical protein